MTFLEAKQDLSRKLNIDFSAIATNGLFTLTDLNEYINAAALRAWDYKPWPFAEQAKAVTTTASASYAYPDDLVLGSIFYLAIGGKAFRKLQFQDYLNFKEQSSTATDKVYAEFGSSIYVNQNAYTVGATMDMYGKKKAVKLSADADLLPFSPVADNNEYSGNEAIVLLAYAAALDSEKKRNPVQAKAEEEKAYFILNALWKPLADSKALKQSDTQLLDVPDYFRSNGGLSSSIGLL